MNETIYEICEKLMGLLGSVMLLPLGSLAFRSAASTTVTTSRAILPLMLFL